MRLRPRAWAAAAALAAWALARAAHPAAGERPGAPAVPASATAAAPGWTQSILDFWPERGRLFVAATDAGEVAALDARTGAVAWRTAVGREPRRLALARTPRGLELLVSCRGAGEVVALDPETGAVRERFPVGPAPEGFDVVAGRYLAVALRYRHELAVWDLAAGAARAPAATGRFPVAVRWLPAAGEVAVAHAFDGAVDLLDAATFAPVATVAAEPEVNQPAGLLPAGGGRLLYLPHVLSNSGERTLHFASAVFPAVSAIDLPARAYLPARRLSLAFVDRPVNGPEALAFFRGGAALAIANSRSNDLTFVSLETSLAIAHVEVGAYPSGLAVDEATGRAFAANAYDQTVSVVDLQAFRELARWRYAEEALPPALARGRRLFASSDSPRMASNQWISCSSCHPEGGTDGRVWRLPGKPPLRTKDLHDVAATLPAGWLADKDEMQDEELFIRAFHRGSGLSDAAPHPERGAPNAGLSADLDALAAWVDSLASPPSPYLEAGKLAAAAERGRALFLSERLACAGCHPPPRFTASTLAAERRIEGLLDPEPSPVPPLDIPSLLGLYAQPRLLHDGRAATPAEVFRRWNAAGRHGHTADLDEAGLRDLEAFLLSLPYSRN